MRQSATYTTKIEGKLVRSPRPLTKGGALLKAREILGPDARVFQVDEDRYIGLMTSSSKYSEAEAQVDVALVHGRSWEQVLKTAEETPEAEAWNDKVIEDANKLAEAINSLRATAIKIIKAGTRMLTRKEKGFIRQGLRMHP